MALPLQPESGLFPDTLVEPFIVAPEVEALAGVVLAEYNEFREIAEAITEHGLRIRFAFEMKEFDPLKEEVKPHTIAKVTKASPIWRLLGETELVIQFRKAFWDVFSVGERRGVLHHELMHVSIDSLTPKVKVSLSEHDVEEFSLTARRFGPRRQAHQLLYKAFADWHHEQEHPEPTKLRTVEVDVDGLAEAVADAVAESASALQDLADASGTTLTIKAAGRETTIRPRTADETDVRPAGDVNVDELRGDVERAVKDEPDDLADLPF